MQTWVRALAALFSVRYASPFTEGKRKLGTGGKYKKGRDMKTRAYKRDSRGEYVGTDKKRKRNVTGKRKMG